MGVRERGRLPSGKRYAFDKPAGARCEHQCAAGCAIYREDRLPIACLTFECEWRKGSFREEERPDRSGVVVTFRRNPSDGEKVWAVVFGGGRMESDPTAWELPRTAARTVARLMSMPELGGIRLASAVIEPGKCGAFRRTAHGWEGCTISYPPELEWLDGTDERRLMRELVPEGELPHGGYLELAKAKGETWMRAQMERYRSKRAGA
jgi:hypothetical protein